MRDLIALALRQAARPVDRAASPARWGMTPQKPLARARSARSRRSRPWLARVTRRSPNAPKPRVRLSLGRRDRHLQSGPDRPLHAPRGETPVSSARPADHPEHDLAVSNRGSMWFSLHQGASNAIRFIAFLRCLIQDAGHKVFLIVVNLKVHHAKPSSNVGGRPRLRYRVVLPAGLCPAAQSRRILEQLPAATAAPAAPDRPRKTSYSRAPASVLRSIQRSSRRIQAYFTPPTMRYAPEYPYMLVFATIINTHQGLSLRPATPRSAANRSSSCRTPRGGGELVVQRAGHADGGDGLPVHPRHLPSFVGRAGWVSDRPAPGSCNG